MHACIYVHVYSNNNTCPSQTSVTIFHLCAWSGRAALQSYVLTRRSEIWPLRSSGQTRKSSGLSDPHCGSSSYRVSNFVALVKFANEMDFRPHCTTVRLIHLPLKYKYEIYCYHSTLRSTGSKIKCTFELAFILRHNIKCLYIVIIIDVYINTCMHRCMYA